MYDAAGVRRHAGMQAEVLNVLIMDVLQHHPISEKKLKEVLGHTPLQVGRMWWWVCGVVVGVGMCQVVVGGDMCMHTYSTVEMYVSTLGGGVYAAHTMHKCAQHIQCMVYMLHIHSIYTECTPSPHAPTGVLWCHAGCGNWSVGA